MSGLVLAMLLVLYPASLEAEAASVMKQSSNAVNPSGKQPNRTLPKFKPPTGNPGLPDEPSDADIFRARVFSEPIVPLGGKSSAVDNRELGKALTAFEKRQEADDFSSLEEFLSQNPVSPWRASLLSNLGRSYYESGYFSKALDAWEMAWPIVRSIPGPLAKTVGDGIVGELARMNARLGRSRRLEDLISEIKDRRIEGPATEKVSGATEGLWVMQNDPGRAFLCGPMALQNVMRHSGVLTQAQKETFDKVRSDTTGFSFWQVDSLAKSFKFPTRIAMRTDTAEILVPSVVHWKIGHYAALVAEKDGQYLMKDPTFGDEIWLTRKVIKEEASGYYLIASAKLPPGWRDVGNGEAKGIFGKGFVGGHDPDATRPTDEKIKGGQDCHGMAVYDMHAMAVSLNITDIPVGITPPKGPAVLFMLTYNQREAKQPSIFSYSNLGPKWTFDWLSYVTDNPASPTANVSVFSRGGGTELFYNRSGSFLPEIATQAELIKVSASPIIYEKRFPDGSKEIFSLPVGGNPRKVFMTAIVDPAGNEVTLSYDESYRIVALTDALGQVSVLEYAQEGDPLKITKVTDPFGRSATIEYNPQGRLWKITDVMGMVSRFDYSGDFISAMTTPYGTTTFAFGEHETTRWLEVTDPLGGKERVEYSQSPTGLNFKNEPTPTGMMVYPRTVDLLHWRNTYYWDPRIMLEYGRDFSKARIYHWNHSHNKNSSANQLESFKNPLESRLFFNYPNQVISIETSYDMIAKPSKIGRVMDDGSTQLYQFEYNRLGKKTKAIDPLGRTTILEYAANGRDLIAVRQKNGESLDLIATATYNQVHQRLSETDATGQTYSYSYNASGQLSSMTDPSSRTTTLTYLPDGYLSRIAGPVSGENIDFEYDGFGRMRRVTLPDGYRVDFEYDALDRLVKRTFPDGTYEQTVYDKLDASRFRDRQGRWSKTIHNALRRPTSFQDAMGRITKMEWCDCGDLETFMDPLGRRTTWIRDIQERLTSIEYPDGRKESYRYEANTSRLKSITDAMGQVTEMDYFPDNSLKRIQYRNAVNPTPEVNLQYDPVYPRVSRMVDGSGTTEYHYGPVTVPPTAGSGRLERINGPLENDDLTLGFDDLGRIVSRLINGIGTSISYDAVGRVESYSNPLGTFGLSYQGNSSRLSSVTYPNGQNTLFRYLNQIGDFRLQEIENRGPNETQISRFGYMYGKSGRINSQTHSIDGAAPRSNIFRYDAIDQLLSSVKRGTGGNVEKQFSYNYDRSGNRTSVQVDRSIESFTYNQADQLLSSHSGGHMRFEGTVSEPSKVSIGGTPAPVSRTNAFSGLAQVQVGVNQVGIDARDMNGNASSKSYQLEVESPPTKAFSYDKNGNLLDDGIQAYGWDAANRLLWIRKGNDRTEFEYDGLGRRVAIREIVSGSIVSRKKYVWIGMDLAEERDDAGTTVGKRFFSQGIQVGTENFFYTADAIGSILEVSDMAGVVRARYDYSPFGERSRIAGDFDSDFGFTGHFYHEKSGLHLTMYRAYSARLGRWISRDPLGLRGGDANLYRYVANNPINLIDPYGLYAWDEFGYDLGQFMVGFGDVLSLGTTSWIRGWEIYGGDEFTDPCSDAYAAGEWAGVATSFATGAVGGVRAAGRKAVGKEFSHWVPNRMGGPRNILNGNYVPKEIHAISDPYRYRFMSKTWKAANPMPAPIIQQAIRVPFVYTGTAAGTAWGSSGKYFNGLGN